MEVWKEEARSPKVECIIVVDDGRSIRKAPLWPVGQSGTRQLGPTWESWQRIGGTWTKCGECAGPPMTNDVGAAIDAALNGPFETKHTVGKVKP